MNNYLLFILVLIAITALILSIFSLNKCKDKFGGSVLNESECNNLASDQKKQCIEQVRTLTTNINSQYSGQPGNRGITIGGGPDAGSFGNPNIIN